MIVILAHCLNARLRTLKLVPKRQWEEVTTRLSDARLLESRVCLTRRSLEFAD